MPVRFSKGACLLQTPGNTILHGASVASISCWIRLNATPSSTVDTISCFYKQFSQVFQILRPATLSNKIRMQLFGSSSVTSDQFLTVNGAYHMLLVWQNGSQQIYLNGVLVGSGTVASNLSDPGANRTFKLGLGGVGQDDLDFTLDDPAVWVNYAGTQQDSLDLRDRVKTPLQVNSASLAWGLTLDGTAGANVVLGDAGIANYGTAGSAQNVSSVSAIAPVYDGTPLIYQSPTQLKTAAVAPSGEGIVFVFEDINAAVTNLSAINNTPTVNVNGSPATLTTPLWIASQPWLYYPLASPVAATDSATVTAPAGWVTTAAGTIAPSVNAPLANLVGGSIVPAFVPGTKTMGAGYNLTAPRYFQPAPYYSNAMKHAGPWMDGSNNVLTTVDGDGYLTALPAGGAHAIVSLCTVGPSGYPGQLPGTWTLQWDGDGIAVLDGIGFPASVTQLSSTLTGTTNNTRTYNVTRPTPGQYYVSVQVTVSSLGTTGVKNLRIWPPGATVGGKWHPQLLRMLTGAKCIRFMDALATNTSTVANFTDFMPVGQCTYGTARPYTPLSISSVSPGQAIFEANRSSVQVTTATPHGLSSGQIVFFPITGATLTLVSGSVRTLDNSRLAVVVVDSTNFLVGLFTGTGSPVNGTQTYPGTVTAAPPPGLPIADVVDLCNVVGCDLWMNVPPGATTACTQALADYVAANLATGRSCYWEIGNEPWNTGFALFEYLYAQAQLDGTLTSITYTRQEQYHVKWAKGFHDLILARYVLAGRPTSQAIRVLGAQFGNTIWIITGLNYGATQGYAFDRVGVAPYFDSGSSSLFGAVTNGFDVDQLLDLTELTLLYQSTQSNLAANLAVVAAQQSAYPGLKLVAYEGGPQSGVVSGTNLETRSQQWGQHPRLSNAYLFVLSMMNDPGSFVAGIAAGTAGLTVWNHFDLIDTWENFYGTLDANWGAYKGISMLAGVGDGSDGRNDNRTSSGNLDLDVTPIGHAINAWNGIPDPGPVTPPVLRGPKVVLDVLRFP